MGSSSIRAPNTLVFKWAKIVHPVAVLKFDLNMGQGVVMGSSSMDQN